jgi:Icc-related predicted phosphoesterase
MRHMNVIEKLGLWWLFISVEIWQLSFASAFTTIWRRRAAVMPFTLRLSLSTSSRENHHNDKTIIIHLDSLHGTSNVSWTLEGLVERATEWRNTQHSSTCMMLLVVNHHDMNLPFLHTGGPLDNHVGVLFLGNGHKTHHVIISLIQECRSKQITVVTDANEVLQQKLGDKGTRLEFIDPVIFLHQIETLATKSFTLRFTNCQTTEIGENKDCDVETCRDLIRQEVTLRQELERLNHLLNPKGMRPNGKKKQISNKRRTKLVGRRNQARGRLSQTTFCLLETTSGSLTCNGALQYVSQKGDSIYSTEATHEERLLAERLRQRLDRAGTISFPFSTDTGEPLSNIYDILWNAKKGVLESTKEESECSQSVNRDARSLSASVLTVPRRCFLRKDINDKTPSRLLRIVTISDTHGYEHELFAHVIQAEETSYLLPSADVLLHCGDFSTSGSRTVKMQAKARLDAFLAAQTHIPTKIVLRGNHDPHSPARALFPRSKATYVTRPTTMTLQHDITLELRPFSRRGTILLLPPCDILASHEPPYGILDLTYQRTRAGSMTLRRAVESSNDKPSLWLCGHIHEGRGSVLYTFVDKRAETCGSASTLVVNAANANAGRADRIVTGPVVIDIVKDTSLLQNVTADSLAATEARADSVQQMTPST